MEVAVALLCSVSPLTRGSREWWTGGWCSNSWTDGSK